jgi:hypothetical protein
LAEAAAEVEALALPSVPSCEKEVAEEVEKEE